MGSTVLLDIISSSIISGLLLLSALRMNEQARVNTFDSQSSLTVQQNLTSIIQNVEYDFRKIGYCSNPNLQPINSMYIVRGDTSDVTFVADMSDNGTLDTVRWYLGTTAIPGTANPNVRMLYRRVNSGRPFASNLGVTQFKLKYFNSLGQVVPTPFSAPSTAKLIEMTLRVEPVAAYGGTYGDTTKNFSVWRQTRLISRNLNAR